MELLVDDVFISESKLGWIGQRDISGEDVAECLRNDPHFFARGEGENVSHSMLGRTDAGGFLLIAIEPLEDAT